MMVAAGQHRLTGRRAERRRVEPGEPEPARAKLFEVRGMARSAEGAGRAVADVVDEHDEDIRRARGRAQLPDRRIFRVGVFGVVGRQAHVRLIRNGKNGSLKLVLPAHRIASHFRCSDFPRQQRDRNCSGHATQQPVRAPPSYKCGTRKLREAVSDPRLPSSQFEWSRCLEFPALNAQDQCPLRAESSQATSSPTGPRLRAPGRRLIWGRIEEGGHAELQRLASLHRNRGGFPGPCVDAVVDRAAALSERGYNDAGARDFAPVALHPPSREVGATPHPVPPPQGWRGRTPRSAPALQSIAPHRAQQFLAGLATMFYICSFGATSRPDFFVIFHFPSGPVGEPSAERPRGCLSRDPRGSPSAGQGRPHPRRPARARGDRRVDRGAGETPRGGAARQLRRHAGREPPGRCSGGSRGVIPTPLRGSR